MEKHPVITKDEARRFLELIALGQQQCNGVLEVTPFVVGYLTSMFEQTWERRYEPGDARDALKLIAETEPRGGADRQRPRRPRGHV